MATDPDRPSDGRPARHRRRQLSQLPGGLHSAFQASWALAIAAPLAAKVSAVVHQPSASTALAVIELSAIWALLAAVAWTLRVVALSTCGRWGARTRHRARTRGRREGSLR